jgi:hypothetical protein
VLPLLHEVKGHAHEAARIILFVALPVRTDLAIPARFLARPQLLTRVYLLPVGRNISRTSPVLCL